jgi:hypothetical protein
MVCAEVFSIDCCAALIILAFYEDAFGLYRSLFGRRYVNNLFVLALEPGHRDFGHTSQRLTFYLSVVRSVKAGM